MERRSSDLTTLQVRQALEGDRESLGWLVARFDPFLAAQVRFRLGGAARTVDVGDVTSEVWLVVLRRLPDLRPRDGRYAPVLVRFLAETALRTCNRFLHRAALEYDRGADPDRSGADPMDGFERETLGVVSRAALNEVHGQIAACLETLDPSKREVLILRLFEHRGNQEIARELDIPANTVAVRYRRALADLRARLPKAIYEEVCHFPAPPED